MTRSQDDCMKALKDALVAKPEKSAGQQGFVNAYGQEEAGISKRQQKQVFLFLECV